jgi:hypothetical protein
MTTSLASLLDSTESVYGIAAENDDVPIIVNHPAIARKNTHLIIVTPFNFNPVKDRGGGQGGKPAPRISPSEEAARPGHR